MDSRTTRTVDQSLDFAAGRMKPQCSIEEQKLGWTSLLSAAL